MELSFCRCVVPECCVRHASLDVVCDVSEYVVWYVRLCEFLLMCVCLLCQTPCSCLMLLR